MINQNNFDDFDLHCMQRALELAKHAAANGEVPIGAVIANNLEKTIIGEGFNQPIASHDATAHAEIVAIKNAGQTILNYRLVNTTLYTTLEPCAMCAGALLHARISRLVFATPDPRAGAIGGAMQLYAAASWNHTIKCEHGLLAQPCSILLKDFFKARR